MNIGHLLLNVVLVCCFGAIIVTFALPDSSVEETGNLKSFGLDSKESVVPVIDEPIQPIAKPTELDDRKIALGKLLFNDPRLSFDNSISCASCHNLKTGGADRLPRSVGINGNLGDSNSPTVFNSGLNIAHFWDGRAKTLEDQIEEPTHNPKEMGSSWPQITKKIESDRTYETLFNRIYADGINSHNIKDAIASFERSLVTVNSPFDRYLRGDTTAINENAKAGYEIFKELGCVACHQGSNVGGNVFQKFGIMGDYFADRGVEITQADLGRYNITGLDEDKYVFRVPSLRLATLTPPYFHDGSVTTIEEAVRTMIEYQLGRLPTDNDETLIVEFLHTLVGEYNGEQLGQ